MLLLYLPLGVYQTTVSMEEAAPSPGLPSTVTAVTQATLVPPAITVSSYDFPHRMGKRPGIPVLTSGCIQHGAGTE